MSTEQKVIREFHSIKPFRGEGGLGIIRLNNLAIPGTAKIQFNEMEFKPIGFDTYGHPIISSGVFSYYKALKLLAERRGESLVPIVEYQRRPFCISSSYYDSREEIEKIVEYNEKGNKEDEKLKKFKQLLVNRKIKAFQGGELNLFVVYGIYVLAKDGHVYLVDELKTKDLQKLQKQVLEEDDIETLKYSKEIHLPDHNDACNICGAIFTIDNVKNGNIAEDKDCNKVHIECLKKFEIAIEHKEASTIIDAVYAEHPESIPIVDSKDGTRMYEFSTSHGKITISFKEHGRIQIKWGEEFVPFDLTGFGYPESVNQTHTVIAKSRDHAINLLIGVKNS